MVWRGSPARRTPQRRPQEPRRGPARAGCWVGAALRPGTACVCVHVRVRGCQAPPYGPVACRSHRMGRRQSFLLFPEHGPQNLCNPKFFLRTTFCLSKRGIANPSREGGRATSGLRGRRASKSVPCWWGSEAQLTHDTAAGTLGDGGGESSFHVSAGLRHGPPAV